MKFYAACIAVIASCLVLSSCGGGGDSSSSAPTVRPKTLDGIRLTLDSNVTFEFVRNTGTPAAAVNGDVENGTFYYTQGGVQLRQYPNTGGDNSDCRYPDSISGVSYSYRAINDVSGLLTLNGVGVNDLLTTGTMAANNGSFTYFFNSSSAGTISNQVELDLTFSSNGASVTLGTSTVRIPGSTTPLWDTVRIPAAMTLVAGGNVPVNYNPSINYLRTSTLVATTLNSKLLVFTNGAGNTANDFTIQFASDASNVALASSSAAGEIGSGLLRIAGAISTQGVNYTYKTIPGTDNCTLTISGSNTTLDGTYTISFLGTDNGRYVGTLDAGTTSLLDVTGTFTIPGGA